MRKIFCDACSAEIEYNMGMHESIERVVKHFGFDISDTCIQCQQILKTNLSETIRKWKNNE